MPVAAKKNTKEGAAAFGEYYLDQHGEAIHSGDSELLSALASDACQACVAAVRQINDDAAKGWTRSTNPYSHSQPTAALRPDGGYKVSMRVQAEKYYRVDEKGYRNGTIDPVEFNIDQHVVWKENNWLMESWIATQQ